MAEFALVLPVLAVLLFGVMQFGIVFNNYETLTDAARAGARKAAVGRQASDPVGDAIAAVRASATDLDQAKLDVQIDPSSAGGFQPGADVTVEASYPYSIDLLGVVIKSGSLISTTTERIE